jgi:DNA-binding transcriptional LysR family regulator
VGRAAEALGLSQPALSRSLGRLERSLDTTLFTRTPKGVELTVVGAAFLSHVQRLRLSVGDIEREVEELTKGQVGNLRVGANSHATEHLLPETIETLLKKAPRLSLNVTVGPTAALEAALLSGRLDLIVSGIIAPAHRDLEQVHLWDDDYYVYASAGHRLAGRKRLGIADVVEERWALPRDAPPTLWLQRTFRDHGFAPPRLTLETSSLSLRLRVVASSNLLDFMPRMSACSAPERLRLTELRVRELAWRRALAARYRRGAYLSPAARFFIDVLKATATAIAARRDRRSG